MVSQVVKERITRLKLDDESFSRALDRVKSNISDFSKRVSKVDNKPFEQTEKLTDRIGKGLGVMGTMVDTLGRKTGLKTSANDMAKLGSTADNTGKSIANASSYVDGMGRKFNILEGIASVALGNIATMGIGKLTNAVKSFTLDPIIGGFREYQRELESTRILATALGEEALPDIKQSMRDLEEYASTTRYNSQSMNTYLARMVNAGADLDQAKIAIMGSGNLAASAGASTQEYDRSMMFGMLQSMQTGYMSLQNWRSMENGNMVSDAFKELLLQRAMEFGTINPQEITKELKGYMFTEGLSDQKWMTNDVMLSALETYATDENYRKLAERLYTYQDAMTSIGEDVQNTWSRVWMTIIGDYNKTWEIWTPFQKALGDILDAPGKAAENMAKIFAEMKGLEHVITMFSTGYNSLMAIFKVIGDIWNKMFPDSQRRIVEWIIKSIDNFTSKMAISGGTLGEIQSITGSVLSIFQKLFTVLGLVGDIFEALIPDNLINSGLRLVGLILSIVDSFGNLVETILSSLISIDTFGSAVDDTGNTVNHITNFIFALAETILWFVDEVLIKWSVSFSSFITRLKNGKYLEDGVGPIEVLFLALLKVIELAGKVISFVSGKLKNSYVLFEHIHNVVHAIVDGPMKKFIDVMKNIYNSLHDFIKAFTGVVMDILPELGMGLIAIPALLVMGITKLVKEGFDILKRGFESFNSFVSNNSFLTKLKELLFGVTVHAEDLGGEVVKTKKSLDNLSKSKVIVFFDNLKKDIKDTMKSTGLMDKETGKIDFSFRALGDTIRNFTSFKWFKNQNDDATESMNKGSSAIDRFSSFLKDKLHVDLGYVIERLKEIGTQMKENILGMPNRLRNMLGEIKKMFSWIDFDKVFKVFNQFWVGIGKFIDFITEPVKKLLQFIKDIFTTLSEGSDNDTLTKSLLFIGMMSFIDKVQEGSGLVDNLKENILGLFGIVKTDGKDVLSELAKTIKDYRKKNFAIALKEFAKAILILSGSLVVMSFVPVDKVKPVLSLLTLSLLAMTSSFALLEYIQIKLGNLKSKNATGNPTSVFQEFANAVGITGANDMFRNIGRASLMIGLAASALILAQAVKSFADQPWQSILTGLGYAAIAMGVMAVVTRIIGTAGSFGSAASILAIIGSLWLITQSFDKIANTDEGIFTKAIDRIGLLVKAIGAGFALMGIDMGAGNSEFGLKLKLGPDSLGPAATILALTFLINKIMKSIVPLALIDKKVLDDAMENIKEMFLPIGLALTFMSGNAKVAGFELRWGDVKLGHAAVILSMIAFILIITNSIQKIAAIDATSLYKAGFIITGLMAVLTASMMLMSGKLQVGDKFYVGFGDISTKMFATLLTVILGIIVLVGQVKSIAADSNIDEMFKATGVVAILAAVIVGIIAAYAAVNKYLKEFQNTDVWMLGTAIVGIILVGGLLKQLSKMPISSMQSAILGMITVVASIGILLAIVGKTKNIDANSIFTLLAVIGGVWIVGDILGKLSNKDWGSMMAAALIIVGTIGALMGIAWLTSQGGGISIQSLGAILALAATIAMAGLTLTLVSSVPTNDIIKAVAAIAISLIVIAGIAALIGLDKTGFTTVALYGIAAAFAGLGVAALGLGAGLKLGAEGLKILYELLVRFVSDFNAGKLTIQPEALRTWLEAMIDNVFVILEVLWEKGQEYGGKLVKAIGKGISDFVKDLPENVKKIWETIKKWFEDSWETIKKTGKKIIEWIVDGMADIGEDIAKKISGIMDSILGFFGFNNDKDGSKRQRINQAGRDLSDEYIRGMSGPIDEGGVERVLSQAEKRKHTRYTRGGRGWSGTGSSLVKEMADGIIDGTKYIDRSMDILHESINSNVEHYFDFTPTITPQLDMSQIGYVDLSGAYTYELPRHDVSISHRFLDPVRSGQESQNDSTYEVVKSLNHLNDRVSELTDITSSHTELLSKKTRLDVNIDSHRVNKYLAPGMSNALDEYEFLQNRLDGRLDDL